MTIENIDQDIELDISEIGKRFLFWAKDFPDDHEFSFSSTLDNIGIKHDFYLKNKTEVIALSEPTEGYHPIMGPILVTKIMADNIMWVLTWSLNWVDDK